MRADAGVEGSGAHPASRILKIYMETSLSGKTCLVTGASGFIGGHVTKLLVEEGAHVRALLRKTSRTEFLDTLPVEKCFGDISDIPSIQRSLEGVEYLFHIAGVVALKESDVAVLRQANVQGVKNVLGVAQGLKVKRVVLTSSVAAIGGSANQEPRDETAPWDDKAPHNAYSRSKHDGEMEAMKYYREGLPLVVVNPSFVIGSPDDGPSFGGKFLLTCLKGGMKVTLPMGLNCVDVKDVAKGHLLAAQKGKLGERYILANENKTLIGLLRLVERVSGVRTPRLHLPYPMAYIAAALIEGIGRFLLRKDSMINRLQVRRSKYYAWYLHDKATRELGWNPRPFEETLSEAVRWFREHHNLK